MNTPTPTSPTTPGIALPSIGSLVGSITALALSHALKLDPSDPTGGGAIIGIVTTAFTAFFHWIGVRAKIPGLG